MALKPPNYRQLRQEDDRSEKDERDEHSLSPSRTRFGRLFVVSHIITLGIYFLSVYSVYWKPSFQACDKKTSTYSPALPIITYQPPKHLNAEIIQKNIYRGPPSPAIDTAWRRIGLGTPAIRLFDSDIHLLNKSNHDPMRPLHRIPEEYGGGYIGMLEVFHLLHCLDAIRQATWPEYYRGSWEALGGEKAVREHNDHCIDMLREVIMCSGDVTPVTFYDALDVPGSKLPMPDFNTLHTCRNFEAILEWNSDNERTIQWDEIGLDLGFKDHIGR